MIVTRGKLKDREVRLSQAANDWITADLVDPLPGEKPAVVLNPTSVRFTDRELVALDANAQGDFWDRFVLHDSGFQDCPHRLKHRVYPHA